LISFYFADDIIEQVADGGVAEAELLGHDLKAAAALHKRYDEILLGLGKTGQEWQAEYTGNLCAALCANQTFDMEH
jgi:hypothetical protein